MQDRGRHRAESATTGDQVHHLDEATVAARLDPVGMVDLLEGVLTDMGRGEAASTLRVRASAGGAMASAMAAVIPAMGVSGGKVYSTVPGRFTFHVVLFDLDGDLLCTLDGAALTEVRTPALSAVAIRRLGPHRATRVALLGTGREALPHLEMLQREVEPTELRVWGRAPDKAEVLVARGRDRGAPAVTVVDADEAVAGVDIVVTVTSSDDPLFEADSISDGTLVCAVGATKAQRCELPPELFTRTTGVVADSAEGSLTECGDLIRAADAGTFDWADLVDLTDLLAGRATVPRAGEPGPVVFESQGLAILDVVAAAQVWARHTEEGAPVAASAGMEPREE
jgi:ornithine cyclodeaminase